LACLPDDDLCPDTCVNMLTIIEHLDEAECFELLV
jgi:hypothetical protein